MQLPFFGLPRLQRATTNKSMYLTYTHRMHRMICANASPIAIVYTLTLYTRFFFFVCCFWYCSRACICVVCVYASPPHTSFGSIIFFCLFHSTSVASSRYPDADRSVCMREYRCFRDSTVPLLIFSADTRNSGIGQNERQNEHE